jgi:hypothetical protein
MFNLIRKYGPGMMLLLIANSALAQTLFDITNSTNQPMRTPSMSSPSTRTLSPSEFSSAVDAVNQQTQANLAATLKQQQANKQLPPPPPGMVGGSTNQPAVTPQAPAESNNTSVMPSTTPNIQNMPAQNAVPANNASSSAFSAFGPAPTAPAQTQTPTYTGFGSGNVGSGNMNSPRGPAPRNNGSSGGWNIKY